MLAGVWVAYTALQGPFALKREAVTERVQRFSLPTTTVGELLLVQDTLYDSNTLTAALAR